MGHLCWGRASLRHSHDQCKPSNALQALVSSVCQQYSIMVSELLDMLHKTEQSLARVRKNKPADLSAAAGSSEISNIQKISLQLLLDIKVLPTGVLARVFVLSLTLVVMICWCQLLACLQMV